MFYHLPYMMFTGIFAGRIYRKLCVLIGAAGSLVLSAQTPLADANAVPLSPADKPLVLALPQLWMLDAGIDAMNTGLPAIAESLLSQVLAQPQELSPQQREQAALILSAAQLSLRQYDQARQTLERWGDKKTPAAQLRFALLDYQSGDIKAASTAMSGLNPASLPDSERSWWWLLEGLIREGQGRTEQAEESFERARSEAVSQADRALFDTAISRTKILSGTATSEMVDVLQKKVQENKNTRLESQFAKELAVLLSQLNRKQESLDVLQGQLDALGADAREKKDQMRLLYAMIDGEFSPKAQAMLQDILRGKGEREIQQNALYMLSRSPQWRMEPDGFLNFLNETLAQTADHSLSDEILLMTAQLNLDLGRFDEASASAARLLKEFPASRGKQQALRLLAQVAMRHDPPRYRVAADYLNRLRGDLPEGTERARLSLLLADLYFLNADYANANALYAELVAMKTPPLPLGDLLFREVLSAVRADKTDEAILQLDNVLKRGGIDPENQWRARWTVLHALQEKGRTQEAFSRLQTLLAGEAADQEIPAELRLRLLWLQAQLSLSLGHTAEAAQMANQLILMLDSMSDFAADKEVRQGVLTHALLLRGQALFSDGKEKEASLVFKRLRDEFPDSPSAMLSYFVQARNLAAAGLLAEAQQRVMTVAEKYPKSKYAPAALYEAAVLAEGQGTVAAYEQATALLEGIAKGYPDSRYVVSARLRQGDLARKLNDFGAALLVYDNLLAAYQNHPERARVEMARADTYLALSAKDATKYSAAEGAFERLFALPDLPSDMRVEAGFKWGFVLERAGNLNGARQAYWLVISQFLRNAGAPVLDETGRYWMSRCLLQLGDLLAARGASPDARTVYALVGEYALPGANVARARIEAMAHATTITPENK